MEQLISAEFFKLRKRMMTWVLAAILVGLVVLLYTVLWSTSVRVETFGERRGFTGLDLRRALFLPGAVPYGLQIVGSFGAILAMILAAGSVGSEYAWGTVRLMATASSGRMRMLTAKLIVVFGLTAAGTLLAVAVAVTYAYIIATYYGEASGSFITGTFIQNELASYGRTLLVLSPYVSFAFAVAVIGRSTLAGVGSGLGVAFIEPIIGGLMRLGGSPWKDIPDYFLSTNRQIVMLQNAVPAVLPRIGGGGDAVDAGALSPFYAGALLLTYTVVFIALALIVFRRRDIGSGQ
jgi:ABC-2 type transport system permease protein